MSFPQYDGNGSNDRVSIVDGIAVIESDPSMIFGGDRWPIQDFTSISLTPNPQSSFTARNEAYDPVEDYAGSLIIKSGNAGSAKVQLGFAFAFGGKSYSEMWISNQGCVSFGSAYSSPRFPYSFDAAGNPNPRVCAAGGIEGDAYLQLDDASAVVTWVDSNTPALQMTLVSGGDIKFAYGRGISQNREGTILAITGQESWWTSGKILASFDNIEQQTGGQLKRAQLLQMGESNAVQFELLAVNPFPSRETNTVTWTLDIGTWATIDLSLGSSGWSGRIDNGISKYTIDPSLIRVDNARASVILPVEFLAEAQSISVQFTQVGTWTAQSPSFSLARVVPVGTNFTGLPQSGGDVLLAKAYFPPFIDPVAVRDRLASEFSDSATWDALAIFTAFDVTFNFPVNTTAYACCGSNGVSGIGTGPAGAESPTLLNFGRIGPLEAAWPFDYVRTVSHEFGHRWLYYFKILEDGVLTRSLNPNTMHPSMSVHMPSAFQLSTTGETSVMGGAYWYQRPDGTYTYQLSKAKSVGYSWHELYLMGLAQPWEVPDWFYMRNSQPVPVNVQQIIDAEGPRVPGFFDAKKDFRVPFVLIRRPGEQVSSEQLNNVQVLRSEWQLKWPKVVGYRATLSTTLEGSTESSGPVSKLMPQSGNAQIPYGGTLPFPLVVAAYDANGNPVKGASVKWTVKTSGATIKQSSSVTGINGLAACNVQPYGRTVVSATSGTSEVEFVSFPVPERIVILSGNEQSGPAGGTLGTALVVEVGDTHGAKTPGVSVRFTATNGTAVPSTAVTDENGRASTTLTLGLNPGVTRVIAAIDAPGYLMQQPGASPVTFIATSLPPVEEVRFALSERGSSSFTTIGGSGSIVVGTASIQPDPGRVSPAAGAIFSYRQGGTLISETAIPASVPLSSGLIPAASEQKPDGTFVDTGIAIVNPSDTAANVSFRLVRDSQFQASTVVIPVPARGQVSQFFSDSPFNLTGSGFYIFTSSSPVSIVALRGLYNQRSEFLMSTLPVFDLSIYGGTASALSHFVNGGGWSTEIFLINPGADPIEGQLSFADAYGRPMNPGIADQTGSLIGYTLLPYECRRLRTSGSFEQIGVGHIRISATGPLPLVFAVFSFLNFGVTVSESAIQASETGSVFRLYGEVTDRVHTGVAIANESATLNQITAELFTPAGTSLGLTGSMTIPANGQASMFLEDIPGFKDLQIPFEGVLRISGNSPISVIGLRGRMNERNDFLITTVPVANEAASLQRSVLWLPHFVNGGGYTTKFSLFSALPGQSPSGTLRFFSQSGDSMPLGIW